MSDKEQQRITEQAGEPRQADVKSGTETTKLRLEIVSITLGIVGLVIGLAFTLYKLPTDWNKMLMGRAYGSCGLHQQEPASINRLNGYLHEGVQYANAHQYEVAAHRFQQVISEDSNFLGAHENLGVVDLMQGKFKDAEASFEAELHVIDCLQGVPAQDRGRFFYMLPKQTLAGATAGNVMAKELAAAEDTVHYNLACAYAKEGQHLPALQELKHAATFHSISRATVAREADLVPLRREPDFQATLLLF